MNYISNIADKHTKGFLDGAVFTVKCGSKEKL